MPLRRSEQWFQNQESTMPSEPIKVRHVVEAAEYDRVCAELQAARDSIQRVLRLAKDIEVGEMTSVVMTAERRREWADEIRSTIETIPEDLQGCCPCENPSHHIEGCRYQHQLQAARWGMEQKQSEAEAWYAQLEEEQASQEAVRTINRELTEQLQAAREENETLRDAVCGTCGRSLAPDGDCFGCSYDRAQAEIERLKGQLTAQHAEIMDALAETKRQLERNRELESEIERLKAFLMTFHIGKPLTSDDAVPAAIDVIIALRQEIERLKRDHINQMTELRFFERRLKERQPPS